MASLQVRWPEVSVTKQKALDDASRMQKRVLEECNKSGEEVPQYQLSELIGKGSFGRVYKATSLATKQLVAIKIIDIDQSDTMDPKMSDTYSDLLKEINALRMLSDKGARNVNHVIEAVPVGQSMWMITEYCAGGSVATLMKPTSPGGLQEKWIIPILREVAEAIFWVHGEGIIHRDLKCANVLVTEVGDVQLCDFGVAGVIETKFDKRTTVIGTPHWMAPELFDPTASYGTEVDIWAFGAMVFEIASGLPPNVVAGMDFSKLGSYVKKNTPHLEGDQYSQGLKDLIAYCLQHDPSKRPTIDQIQRHRYIYNTEESHPTESLAHLVRAFKLWEAQGGDRRSLFNLGGAQAPADISAAALADDEWNFSTTAAFDQQVFNNGDAQDVFDVYGSDVDFIQERLEDTAKPRMQAASTGAAGKGGRRRPPPHLPSVKAPLEKIFDPNTMSNYEDNSRAYYGRMFAFPPPQAPAAAPASDLPLRDDSAPTPDVRESLIDLDASLGGSDLSNFVDMNTLRAGEGRMSIDYNDFGDPEGYDQAPLSDPADSRMNRRTQDWKFPTAGPTQPPASANPEVFRFPAITEETATVTPASARPQLIHRPTEPVAPSTHFNDLAPSRAGSVDHRASTGSLIDLDMSMPDTFPEYPRPSTSHSEAGSISGSEMGSTNPFELEKHASLYAVPSSYREPSIYVSDDSEFANALADAPLNGDVYHYEQQAPLPPPPLQHHHQQNTQQYTQQYTQQQNGIHQNGIHQNGQPRPYSLSDFADMDPEEYDDPTPYARPPNEQFFTPSVSSFSSDPAPRDDVTLGDPSLSSSSSFHEPLPPLPSAETAPSPSRPSAADSRSMPQLPPGPSSLVMQGQASSREVKEELRRMAMCLNDHLSYATAYLSGVDGQRPFSMRLETVDDLT